MLVIMIRRLSTQLLALSLDELTDVLQELAGSDQLRNGGNTPVVRFAKKVLNQDPDDRLDFACSRDVALYFSYHYLPAEREQVVALFLDSQNRLIQALLVTIGTIDAALVHPRDIYSQAIRMMASAVILVHNHPGGECQPSEQDTILTHRLRAVGQIVGIPLLDHLIVCSATKFYSFAEEHLLEI